MSVITHHQNYAIKDAIKNNGKKKDKDAKKEVPKAAFNQTGGKQETKKCYKCKHVGHIASNCP